MMIGGAGSSLFSNMSKGQTTIGVGLAFSLAGLLAAGLTGYYSAQIATAEEFGKVAEKQAIITTRIDNNVEKIQAQDRRLDRFENKLDALLLKSGINPTSIKE